MKEYLYEKYKKEINSNNEGNIFGGIAGIISNDIYQSVLGQSTNNIEIHIEQIEVNVNLEE